MNMKKFVESLSNEERKELLSLLENKDKPVLKFAFMKSNEANLEAIAIYLSEMEEYNFTDMVVREKNRIRDNIKSRFGFRSEKEEFMYDFIKTYKGRIESNIVKDKDNNILTFLGFKRKSIISTGFDMKNCDDEIYDFYMPYAVSDEKDRQGIVYNVDYDPYVYEVKDGDDVIFEGRVAIK